MGRPKGSTNRPKRKTFDERRNTLTYDNRDPNYVYRVVNDTEGRVNELETYGYEVVHSHEQLGDATADTATAVGSAVTRPVGGGVNGVLMRIRREDYEEDQAMKQKQNEAIDESIRSAPKKEGHYGAVTIQRR